jgi:hypothetical protein
MLSSGIWLRVALLRSTDISEKQIASTFRVTSQYVPRKRLFLLEPRGVISQKTATFKTKDVWGTTVISWQLQVMFSRYPTQIKVQLAFCYRTGSINVTIIRVVSRFIKPRYCSLEPSPLLCSELTLVVRAKARTHNIQGLLCSQRTVHSPNR